MSKHFTMDVKEVYKFNDTRVIFVGIVNGGKNFISETKCRLFLDDQEYCKILIEGEMIPKNPEKRDLRSLSTLDFFGDIEILKKSKCKLISLEA